MKIPKITNKTEFEEMPDLLIREFDKIKNQIHKSKRFIKQNIDNKMHYDYDKNISYGVISTNNTVMLCHKSYLGYKLIEELYTNDLNNQQKVPELIYNECNKPICNYSSDLLIFALNIFNKFKKLDKEAVTISIKDDYPITIENNHIKILIAPRGI